MTTIQIIINGQEFEAKLNDNEAVRQFTEMRLFCHPACTGGRLL